MTVQTSSAIEVTMGDLPIFKCVRPQRRMKKKLQEEHKSESGRKVAVSGYKTVEKRSKFVAELNPVKWSREEHILRICPNAVKVLPPLPSSSMEKYREPAATTTKPAQIHSHKRL